MTDVDLVYDDELGLTYDRNDVDAINEANRVRFERVSRRNSEKSEDAMSEQELRAQIAKLETDNADLKRQLGVHEESPTVRLAKEMRKLDETEALAKSAGATQGGSSMEAIRKARNALQEEYLAQVSPRAAAARERGIAYLRANG